MLCIVPMYGVHCVGKYVQSTEYVMNIFRYKPCVLSIFGDDEALLESLMWLQYILRSPGRRIETSIDYVYELYSILRRY